MRVEPMGPVLAALANLFGAGLLGGGGWLAVSFAHGALSDPETTVDAVVFGAVALFGALVAYVGLGTLLHNRERRRSTRRLATQGVDGAAEVIAFHVASSSRVGPSSARRVWLTRRPCATSTRRIGIPVTVLNVCERPSPSASENNTR